MTGEDRLKITRRNLPHWQLTGRTYFITFRVTTGQLSSDERKIVLDHIRSGHQRFYDLIAAVVILDHTHVLLKPNDGMDLGRIMKGIKGVSARLINQLRNATGQVWLDESFDRIIRDQAEHDEKLAYMIHNPAKAELVPDGWDYPWLFVATSADG